MLNLVFVLDRMVSLCVCVFFFFFFLKLGGVFKIFGGFIDFFLNLNLFLKQWDLWVIFLIPCPNFLRLG